VSSSLDESKDSTATKSTNPATNKAVSRGGEDVTSKPTAVETEDGLEARRISKPN
jgi:hypothetical protein